MAQGDGDDTPVVLTMIILITCGVCFAIWWFFSAELMSFVRWIRFGQIQLAAWIFGTDYVHSDYVILGDFSLAQLLEFMNTVDAYELLPEHIGLFTRASLEFWRPLFAVILLSFSVWAYLRGPGTKFHRKMDLNGVLEEHSKSFPSIRPFVNFDPLKQQVRAPGTPVPAKLPLFAESLSPEEWVSFNMIPMSEKRKLDEQSTYGAFVQQLGRRWKGLSHLKPHERALFAVCALKSVRRREQADGLLDEMALCWDPKKGWKQTPALKEKVNRILKDPKISKECYLKANQHAYVKTALLRALQYARQEGGVLASAQFVWLRGFDRGLWYPLNNLGRRSFHTEAMSVMAHFQAEKSMERPIPVPQVMTAIESLQRYFDTHPLVVIPEISRQGGKK